MKKSIAMLSAFALVLGGVIGFASTFYPKTSADVFSGFSATDNGRNAILTSTMQEEELTSPDGEYSMEVDMHEGLVLDLKPGDNVVISDDGNMAYWINENGEVIAVITMQTSGDAEIEFDVETGSLAPDDMQEQAGVTLCSYTGVPKSGCGKTAKVVWTWAWTGLVCAPATVGTAGLTTNPVAIYTAGRGCYKVGKWIYKAAC